MLLYLNLILNISFIYCVALELFWLIAWNNPAKRKLIKYLLNRFSYTAKYKINPAYYFKVFF